MKQSHNYCLAQALDFLSTAYMGFYVNFTMNCLYFLVVSIFYFLGDRVCFYFLFIFAAIYSVEN